MSTPLLTACGLTVEIGGKQVCSDLNLDIHAGQCWALLGTNGIGKTTLLHTLAGLRTPTAGQILLNGLAIDTLPRRQVARQMGLLLQEEGDAFPGTVLETALSGRHPHLGRWQWESAADIALAEQALAQVGLAGLETRQINTLSGGERRRLSVATLLTQDPRLFLLDEPTNHLDPHQQITLLEQLTSQVQEETRGLLMILHDVNLASRFCDHALLLFGEGESLYGPLSRVLRAKNIERLYSHPVIELDGPRGPIYLPQ
ncbi:MAG: ABC transporter ATP-binding protein [Gammaproteobacteria bacterium]|nr:ABC transporter ATP-binding protein [Gammaproteobacteria bacterium]MCF6362329.1 ABC transporter ATP-binding protein [Gammaproteobacteria bacterium]